MGILPPLPSSQKPTPAKRKPAGAQIDFSNLAPLNSAVGTKNFSGYREASSYPRAKKDGKNKKMEGGSGGTTKGRNLDAMDSDGDDDDDDDDEGSGRGRDGRDEMDDEADMKDGPSSMLSPEDAARQGELAEGVRKIKVGDVASSYINTNPSTAIPLIP